jgi:hypothetical protein
MEAKNTVEIPRASGKLLAHPGIAHLEIRQAIFGLVFFAQLIYCLAAF